jgi:Tfp pilus assembly protein PilX
MGHGHLVLTANTRGHMLYTIVLILVVIALVMFITGRRRV